MYNKTGSCTALHVQSAATQFFLLSQKDFINTNYIVYGFKYLYFLVYFHNIYNKEIKPTINIT